MKPVTGTVCVFGIVGSIIVAIGFGIPGAGQTYGSHPGVAVWSLLMAMVFACIIVENIES